MSNRNNMYRHNHTYPFHRNSPVISSYYSQEYPSSIFVSNPPIYQIPNQIFFPVAQTSIYNQGPFIQPLPPFQPGINVSSIQSDSANIISNIPVIQNMRKPSATSRQKRTRELHNLSKISHKHDLKISVFNAHSVQNKHKRINIVDFIIDEHIDIMFITESWLRVSGEEAILQDLTPAGYKIISVPRESRGGGLLAIFRDHLLITSCTTFPFNHKSFELLQLTLTSPHIHFFCLYRVPARKQNGLKNSDFATELPDLLEFTNFLRGKSIILGDFNVHFNKQDDCYTKKILEITHSFNFVQGVNEATFIRSGNTVDWLLYRESDNIFKNCYVTHLLTSDHTAVVCRLKATCPVKEVEYTTVREIHKIDKELFKIDVATLVQELGPEATAEDLHNGLKQLLDKHAPLVRKKIPLRKDPWYPDVAEELREAKRQRRRAERRRNKTKLTIDKQILDTKKQIVTNIVDSAKENYYCSLFANRLDSKQFSKISNKLLGKCKQMNLPNDNSVEDYKLPKIFSTYFNDKIRLIQTDIDKATDSNIDPLADDVPCDKSILNAFKLVTSDEVYKTIMKSKKKTCPLDPIPTSLLIDCIEELLPLITNIINRSLSSGTFPNIFKHAIVTPLLKKSTLDPNVLKNYRPISNLSFLSKIIEKIILSQLIDYLNSNNLFPKQQSAYRPSHSTETVLLKVMNDIRNAVDSGNFSLLTLLDLSAAFDTIDHTILLRRLQHSYGIKGTALAWLSSYLTDRSQKVITNNYLSVPTTLEYGVPQGSVLGPILFLLYTKPIASLTEKYQISCHNFADDTQLQNSSSICKLSNSVNRMENCIDNVKSWMTTNKLRLNDEKTEALLFHSKTKVLHDSPSTIIVGQSNIQFSKQAKNLGFTITNTLEVEKHISNVCRSCNNELRKISSIRHLLTLDATKTLVCTLILSKLDYCNSLLANTTQVNIQKLQKIQNAAAKLVFRAKRFDHVKPLLKELHWLPVEARIKYKISLLCFKFFTDTNFPLYLKDILEIYKPKRNLRSINDTRLLKAQHITRTSIGDGSFSVCGPSTWNSLPFNVRHSDTLSKFKSSLKTYLFRLSFDS